MTLWYQDGRVMLAAIPLLVGATLWIETSIHSLADENLRVQETNERRLTALEVQAAANTRATELLALETDKLRDAVGEWASVSKIMIKQLQDRK